MNLKKEEKNKYKDITNLSFFYSLILVLKIFKLTQYQTILLTLKYNINLNILVIIYHAKDKDYSIINLNLLKLISLLIKFFLIT